MIRKKPLIIIVVIALVMALGPALCAAESSAPTSGKPAKSAPVSMKRAEKAGVITPININTADSAELQKLPGIGPATAKEIVSYRDAKGPFKSIDELKQVKGLKGKKFEAIQDKVTVE